MFSEILLAVVVTFFLAIGGLGLGQFMIKQACASIVGLELIALRMLSGFGLLGLLFFVIGSWQWHWPIVLLILVPLGICGLRSLVEYRGHWLLDRKVCYYSVAIAVLCFCFVAGISRPTGDIGNDAISYHLMGPAKWSIAGKIAPVLDQSHTAFPATVEVLFGAGMLLANDRAPGLFDSLFAAILLIQIRGLTKLLSPSELPAALAVSLAATMPVIMLFASNGFIDIAYSCFVLASVRFALDKSTSSSSPLLVGVFSGFAVGTKYTGIIFLVILTLVILVFTLSDGFAWKKVKAHCTILAVAMVIGSPWYLRNWWVLGSPIYPIPLMLDGIFRSPTFPPTAVLHFHEYILERGKGLGRGVQWLLAIPFTFTFCTARFHGAGGIGLGPLSFGPLGALVSFRNRNAQFLGAIATLVTVTWFFTQQESRFLIPVIAISAVFAGVGASLLTCQQSTVGRLICWSSLVVSLSYGAATIAYRQEGQLLSLRGPSAESQWLKSQIPYYAAFNFLNETRDVSRVLVLDPTVPVFYLHKRYIKPEGMYRELSLPNLGSQITVAQASVLGVTHILDVESQTFGRHFQLQPSTELKIVFDGAGAHVFKLQTK